jgi:adenylate cyclase class 2
MNNELELRILDVDVKKVEKKLKSLGATKVGSWNYTRYIYDTNPVDENKWIRLRYDGKKTELTYKNYKSNLIDGIEELEIEVSDLEKTKQFLEILGYSYRSVQQNKRIRYMLDDVEIDIDTWPHLNTFVEVEGPSVDKVNKIIDYLKEFGSEVTGNNVQTIYMDKGYTKEDLNNLHF